MGHQEIRVTTELAGSLHLIEWELVVGGKGLRPEIGEAVLGVRPADSDLPFEMLTPDGTSAAGLGDHAWTLWRRAARRRMDDLNQRRRRGLAERDDAYWQERHRRARRVAAELRAGWSPPQATVNFPAHNTIDHYVNARLAAAGVSAAALPPLLDEDAFCVA